MSPPPPPPPTCDSDAELALGAGVRIRVADDGVRAGRQRDAVRRAARVRHHDVARPEEVRLEPGDAPAATRAVGAQRDARRTGQDLDELLCAGKDTVVDQRAGRPLDQPNSQRSDWF